MCERSLAKNDQEALEKCILVHPSTSAFLMIHNQLIDAIKNKTWKLVKNTYVKFQVNWSSYLCVIEQQTCMCIDTYIRHSTII